MGFPLFETMIIKRRKEKGGTTMGRKLTAGGGHVTAGVAEAECFTNKKQQRDSQPIGMGGIC